MNGLNCETCGTFLESHEKNKLLSKYYCRHCISKARSDRRKQLERALAKKERDADTLGEKHSSDARKFTLAVVSAEIFSEGPSSIQVPNLPIRLKRNERAYYLCGPNVGAKHAIALALTNNRLFYVDPVLALEEIELEKKTLSVSPGIHAFPLSNVIAIDAPVRDKEREYKVWLSKVHLDKGKDISIRFLECRSARRFHVLIAEMVDRLNDPIDETVFSPKRERMSDDIKVAVWRRDRGECVRCGSRRNLEYDHIIPVSKGGSNTVRNIELLCETCNRKKSNLIG